MSTKLEKLKLSLLRNEFVSFLTGEINDYKFICPYAEMPTDPDQAFDAIKEYYFENNDLTIWIKFQDAIEIMSNQCLGAWLNVYYISTYLSFRNYKKIEFIQLNITLKIVVTGLLNFKDELVKNKNWGGNQFEKGLWDDAVRLIKLLNEEFQLEIQIE